ncbi:unnamed protein product [Prunus armeniaca]
MMNFSWAGLEGGQKGHLVKWELVTQSAERWGLNIGNLLMKNIALLGKCLWTFPLVGESLWHAVIRSKYGFEENGRDENPAQRGSSWSPWKDILSRKTVARLVEFSSDSLNCTFGLSLNDFENEDLSSLQAILKIQLYSMIWKAKATLKVDHGKVSNHGHAFLLTGVSKRMGRREAEVSWAIPKGCHALCEKHVEFGGKKRAKERNRRLFEDNGGMEVEDLWY